jgi:hypothetical protein
MEILDMKFAGIPVGTLIVIAAVWFGAKSAWTDWRQHRADVKEIEEANKQFNKEHEWKPRMINGVDCGEWVRKDGRPLGIDD